MLLVLDGVLLKIKSVLPNVLLLYPTAYIAYPPASLHRVVKVLPVIDASPLFTSVSLYSSITYSTKATGGRDCDGGGGRRSARNGIAVIALAFCE